MKDVKIDMPGSVRYILNTLNEAGYEAYIVGGCVRDSLINRNPGDWDITTSALPEQVLNIFTSLGCKVVETGLKHGTVTIIINKESFEVTTYRVDGDYSDGRHPDSVTFTRSLKEDLARRDFTINSMSYNESRGLLDYFNGTLDIKNKIIRCVGNGSDRFNEDALRMLRCIRFSCQLDFDIDKQNLLDIFKISDNIKKISFERIREELNKILISQKPEKGLILLAQSKLLENFIPEFKDTYNFNQHSKYHDKDVFMHTISVVKNVPCNLEMRLAALLHDIGKPRCFTMGNDGIGHFYKHEIESQSMAKKILTRLKFDNKTIDTVCKLIYNHMTPTNLKNKSIKKLIIRVGRENIYNLLKLMKADRMAAAQEFRNYSDILSLKYKIDEIINQNEPLSVKELAVNGGDLMEIGYKQGKEIGIILNSLIEKVLDNPELNTREQLLKMAVEKKRL